MLCKQCSAELEADARFCGTCGSAVDQGGLAGTHVYNIQQGKERETQGSTGKELKAYPSYTSSYKTGREMATFISFTGWLVVSVGIIAIIATLKLSGGIISVMDLIPIAIAILIGILGVVLVVFGQWVRATFDTADFVGEMLAIMKTKQE